MKRRWLARSVLVACVLLLSGAVVLAARPDVRRQLRSTYNSEGIGAPDATSTLPTNPTAVPTTPLVPAPLRIAVVGDVGTGGDDEYRTAEAIDSLETDFDYDALLMLGDNVYPDGDPGALQAAVFDPFAAVLDGGTQLLPVLGNHDVRDGNGDAHADAIGMPNRWYATEFENLVVISLDSTRPEDAEQLSWLEATLESTDATWIIATMHHPPYSGGYHGSDFDVREAFSPLFERFGVQLVLAGHDHDYQRSQPIEEVTYVVSGGAAKLRPANMADFTEVAWSTYHFVDLVIWPDRLDLRAVDQQGDLFDSITLTP